MTNIAFVAPKSVAQGHYEAYLQSFRWRKVVRPVRLWIDGYKCRVCECASGPGNPLNVHHTPSAYKFKNNSSGSWTDLVFRLADIIGEIQKTITLCERHHHKIHEGQVDNRRP